jgi:hypothetical protein
LLLLKKEFRQIYGENILNCSYQYYQQLMGIRNRTFNKIAFFNYKQNTTINHIYENGYADIRKSSGFFFSYYTGNKLANQTNDEDYGELPKAEAGNKRNYIHEK